MAKQYRLGEFWLAWRTDRKEWAICWNDRAAGTRRRKSTAVGDFNGGEAPVEAQEKLAAHFTKFGTPEKVDVNSVTSVSRIMGLWLAKEGSLRARGEQYAYAVDHMQRFIDKQGRMAVDEINPIKMQSYVAMRLGEGVKGETIHGELAALSRALKWAVENSLIPYAPFVGRVDRSLRSGPKEIEYSMEQVAALLEVALSRFDRKHVHLFSMIMLSAHGRVEAVMELYAEQIRNGLFYFNAPGRMQTTKRRMIVPVAPTLAPWLPRDGKVIQYQAMRKDGSIITKPTRSIKTSFAKCLKDAGIINNEGEPWGSPNSLRHTIHTFMQTQGVPQAQIDAMAGHQEPGSGRNYTHLRPEYLKEAMQAIEYYWSEMDGLTTAHRSQLGPKRYDLKTRKSLQ